MSTAAADIKSSLDKEQNDKDKKNDCELEVPEDFNCPISYEVMTSPVVASDGFSYSALNILEWIKKKPTSPKTNEPLPFRLGTFEPDLRLYDNIILKCIIDNFKTPEKILAYLKCPITHKIFVDPVIAPDGYTFEKEALKKALANTGATPLSPANIAFAAIFRGAEAYYGGLKGYYNQKSGTTISEHDTLFPNTTLKMLIEEFQAKYPIIFKADPQFLYKRGNDYLQGNVSDVEKAAKFFREAADSGHKDAQFNMGFNFHDGVGVTKNLKLAIHYYQLAAKQGHSDALYALGLCYESGDGVTPDSKKAAEHFRLAAEKGHVEAEVKFGMCLEKGIGVDKNPERATTYYHSAALCDNIEANFMLGNCFRKGIGTTKDENVAIDYYEVAAKKKHPGAMNILAFYYDKGTVIKQDLKKAAELYKSAADKGFGLAQYNLALCYKNGRGTPKDIKIALKYFQDAAKQKIPGAQENIDELIAENNLNHNAVSESNAANGGGKNRI